MAGSELIYQERGEEVPAAYHSIPGSCWGIGRGSETTAAPSPELLNLIFKKAELCSALYALVNASLLLEGKPTVIPSVGFLFTKPFQVLTK